MVTFKFLEKTLQYVIDSERHNTTVGNIKKYVDFVKTTKSLF